MSRKFPAVVCAAALAAVLASAAPADAKTYQVAGRQIAKDEEAGKYVMRGGLLGKWRITSFEEAEPGASAVATGTERFRGCLNRDLDRSCQGDPKGTLEFSFDYWASFDGDELVWGSCYHPITSGTGAFTGADGVLMMVDSPTARDVKTRYIGSISLDDGDASASSSAAADSCG